MIPGVPYDAEIEYLQSSGTQYIDTGVSMAGITTWMANIGVACMPYTARENPFFSIWTSTYNYWNVFLRDGKFDLYHGGHFYYQNATIQIGVPYDVIVGYDTNGDYGYKGFRFIGLNGETPSTLNVGTQFANPTTLKLFARGDLNTSNFGKCRIYYVTVKNGVNKILDFIPVRVGQTGYMYDRVTRRLFGNKGTGSFVLGPDVAKPVMGLWGMRKFIFSAADYIGAPNNIAGGGLIAMWDGIENAGWGTHIADYQIWKDLIGNRDFSLISGFSHFENNAFSSDIFDKTAGHYSATSNWTINNNVVITVEIVYRQRTTFTSYGESIIINPSTNNYSISVQHNNNGPGDAVSVFRSGSKLSGENLGIIACSAVKNYTGGWLINGIRGSANSTYGPSMSNSEKVTKIGNRDSGDRAFDGLIYTIRFYNRALTESEELYNYKIDKARFNLP